MVNLPFEDVEKMRKDKDKAEEELAKLKEENARLKLGTDTGSLASSLVCALRSSLKIIQWAQGNYDPETVIGWPFQDLRDVAAQVKLIPGVTPEEIEWADDAKQYAIMAEVVHRARRAGRQKELAQIPRGLFTQGPTAYAKAADELLQQPPQDEAAPEKAQKSEQTEPLAAPAGP
jgi:hypothetical protein